MGNILVPKVDALINHGSVNNFQNIHEDPGLPPLGSRVVRGPDWLWGNQDTEGPGTIFNHALDSKNYSWSGSYIGWLRREIIFEIFL